MRTSPLLDVKKIAVLRANAVGDFIVTLPALQAIRDLYPRAEIVLLARHWHADFLAGRPGPVDRVITVPYARGVYDPPAVRRDDPAKLDEFFVSMAREEFDLAFQLHGGGRYSNPFVTSLGAKLTIGAKTPDAQPLDRWVPYRLYRNETLRLIEIVSLVGARPISLYPRLRITDNDMREAYRVVPGDGRPIVVVSPGCSDQRRRWPPRKFAAVADALSRIGGRIIINGNAGEEDAVQEMIAAMRMPAVSVCGILSLRGLAGLLTRASLLISNDSGPLHIALALDTPTVGLFWCGNLPSYGPTRCRRSAVHVSWTTKCPVCGADCMNRGCLHRESFVSEIPTEDVLASAVELFREGILG